MSSRCSRTRPAGCAGDDVQWLDPSSERTLEFALRRLWEHPVRLLLARRSEVELPPPLALDALFPTSACARAGSAR